MAGQRLYRALPAGALILRDLGAFTAAYHRRSGQTHLLAAPAREILAVLAEVDGGAGDGACLAERLAERFDLDAEGDVPAIVATHLAEMAALGLVVTCGA